MISKNIVASVTRSDLTPRQVAREFKQLLAGGVKLSVAGKARTNPGTLLHRGLLPKHRIELFDTVFYLTGVRQIPELRFFVGYVFQKTVSKSGTFGKGVLYPRIFYKDLSLAWRAASHFSFVDGNFWVGKGDVRITEEDGFETVESIEATTDLPVEMQTACESLLEKNSRAKSGEGILELVLRLGPSDRVEPYADFSIPRRRAQSVPGNLINRGKPVARFKRPGDPKSLLVVKGFEPDFKKGVLEQGKSFSKLYGGQLARFRILSVNRLIQYYFIAGPRHVWIVPPQATTTQLSSYGVRTIDVVADDDLFIPGYEYHHIEQTPHGDELYSQIPSGYAGDVCPVDDSKADASRWLNQIPLIRQFRKALWRQ